MGINITAIFPIPQFDKQFDRFIDKIENQEYASIKKYYDTLLEEGYPEIENYKSQWFVDDEKVTKRPDLPSIRAALQLSQNLVMRFRHDGLEIWSIIRANRAIVFHPKIGQNLLDIYTEIGRDFKANQCWIMGDDNPIYHSFSKNDTYKSLEKKDPRKESLKDLYIEITEGEYAGCYDIKGHYTLKIN